MTDTECRCKVCLHLLNLETELAAAHQEVADLRRAIARDIDAHRESAGHPDGCLCARCCALTAAAGVAEWGTP